MYMSILTRFKLEQFIRVYEEKAKGNVVHQKQICVEMTQF